MKAIIIGSGLGGLLIGAKLSKLGYKVEIFERLPFIGGRFANLEYKGFKLTTGALHMIPHGSKGPLAMMLREIGANVKIIDSKPIAIIRMENGNDIEFGDFKNELTITKQVKLGTILALALKFKPKDISFRDWTLKHFDDDFLLKLADSFGGWSLSLQAKDIPASEMLEIIENMHKYKGPGVPLGGCGAVVSALTDVIKTHGGKLHINKQVDKIITDGTKALGVNVNGEFVSADIVISNIGHVETSKMYEFNDKTYLEKLKNIKPSKGIKICFSSDEPLIGHSGVLFTPYAERINGINGVTNIDPELAPSGKHLLMSHQTMVSDNIENEINIGLSDIKKIFPNKKYEIILIQSHSGNWPVNRSASGYDIGNKTPISNLYIVGDGAKGKGGIEVEGIALGVGNLMAELS